MKGKQVELVLERVLVHRHPSIVSTIFESESFIKSLKYLKCDLRCMKTILFIRNNQLNLLFYYYRFAYEQI